MKTYTLLLLVLTTIVSSVNAQTLFQFRHLALQNGEKEELSAIIRSYQAISLNPKAVSDVCAKGNCSFTLKTPEREWNITLEENNLLSPDYQMAVNGKSITQQGSTVKTYKGFIGANPDNYVRLTIGNDFLDGYLKIDSTLLFIKPIKHILPNYKGSNQFLLFNSTDIINNPSVSDCGVLSSTKKLGDQINAQNTNTLQSNSNACHFLEIATEADFEFYQLRGSNVTTANNSILSELNQVEGLYESTFNMSFVVSFQNVWTTSNDPYSTTTSMPDLLSEFKTKWQNDFSNVKRDYVHFFSGQTGLNFRGIAATWSVGRICEVSSGTYAITAANVANINIANTTAHEIAHLFQTNPGHLGSTCTTLMCTLTPANGPDYRSFSFAQATINEINNWISNNGNCLDYPIEISGNSTLCTSNSTYAIVSPTGSTVSWSVSPSSRFAVDVGSGSSFTTRATSSSSAGAGIITATITGSCNFIVTKNVWVSSFPSQPIIRIPIESQPLNCNYDALVWADSSPNDLNFDWEVVNNGTIVSEDYDEIIVDIICPRRPIPGWLTVKVKASNGCGSTGYATRSIDVTTSGTINPLSVYPNPANNAITINLTSLFANKKTGEAEVYLYNNRSEIVYYFLTKEETVVIPTDNIMNGLYHLKAFYLDKTFESHIKIEH